MQKNALHNVNGYSPNQLVLGRNPNIPTLLNNRVPTLEEISTNELVANNLNAMHAARSFVENESSEKIRARQPLIQSAFPQKYTNSDLVYFKRNESEKWMGPGTVIGWEAKQVLIKHGGTYVRVHPCQLMYHLNQIEQPVVNSDSDTVENPEVYMEML